MKLKTNLMMTASERAVGRFMRAPDHDAGTPAPAAAEPAPAPSPAPAADEPKQEADPAKPEHGMEEDFAEFEAKARGDKPAEAKEEEADEPDADADDSSDNADDVGGNDGDGADTEPQLTDEQKRIKELEEQLAQRDEQRQREQAEELRRLREENEKLRNPDRKDDGERDENAPPDPKDYEFGDADSQYIMDMAEWKAERKYEAREQRRRLELEFQEMEQNWETQISSDEVKAEYPDFEEKVLKSANRGDWVLSPEASIFVRSSPVGAHVAHHLASDPAESRRIASLSVAEQALEIGRIEGRYMARGTASSQPARETPSAQPSKAPPPPKKTVRGTGGRFDVDPATDDFAAFEAKSRKVLESQ